MLCKTCRSPATSNIYELDGTKIGVFCDVCAKVEMRKSGRVRDYTSAAHAIGKELIPDDYGNALVEEMMRAAKMPENLITKAMRLILQIEKMEYEAKEEIARLEAIEKEKTKASKQQPCTDNPQHTGHGAIQPSSPSGSSDREEEKLSGQQADIVIIDDTVEEVEGTSEEVDKKVRKILRQKLDHDEQGH